MFSHLYSIYVKNMLNFANFGTKKVWIAVFSISNHCFQYVYDDQYWYIAYPKHWKFAYPINSFFIFVRLPIMMQSAYTLQKMRTAKKD